MKTRLRDGIVSQFSETLMRRKRAVLVLLAALLFSGSLASGQDLSTAGPKKARTAEDYKPRALKEIAAMSALETASEGNSTEVVTGDLLPSRVRVTYQASQRPISKARQKIIFNWAQRYAGDPQHYTLPYQTELLFREAGLNYWLVVNKDLVPRFREEMKKDTTIDLNLIRLGGFKTKGKWVWVLLVESFAERSGPNQ